MRNDDSKNFCSLFNQTPEMVCTLKGPDHVFDFVNAAHIRILGFDATGLPMRVAQPESVELHGILDDVYRTGVTANLKEIPVTLDRRLRYFNLTYAPRYDADGAVNGIMILGSEVTDQVLFREVIQYQNHAFELVLSGEPLESILSLLAAGVEKMTAPDTRASILVLDRAKKRLRHAAAPKLPRSYVNVITDIAIGESAGTCGVAAWFGEEVFTPDISSDPNWLKYRDVAAAHDLHSCWSFPVMSSRGDVLGTFALYNLSKEYMTSAYRQVFDLVKRTTSLVLERHFEEENRSVTETALKYSEEHLHMAVAVSGVGFYDWDIPNDRIVFSERMRKDWGIDERSNVTTFSDALQFVHPADRDRVQALVKDAVEKRVPYDVEYRVVGSNGVCTWVEVRGQVSYDEHGQPRRFFGTSVNINERKLQEETLRESEEQFRLFAEVAPQMPFIADADGSIDYFNKYWFDYVGAEGQDSKGWNWAAAGVIHPEDLALTIDHWRESLRTGDSYQREHRIRRFDGQYRWHLARAMPIRDSEGKIKRWFGTNVDIHDHKVLAEQLSRAIASADLAKEAAEKANNVKSAFLANMSHEIRTPLGAILGFTDLLKQSPRDAADVDVFLETISRNGKALTRIIDDILDLSKVEAGHLDLETIDFSLHGLLRDLVALFSENAKAQGVSLTLDVSDGVPDVIVSDPTRLRQIFINIVGNAVKFTSKGGIAISAVAKRISDENFFIEVRVKDSGGGIQPRHLDTIFQPFTQGDNSTARRFGGSGLGLPLSRRLAKALGGDVYVEHNELGVGCVFTITFMAVASKRKRRLRDGGAKLVFEGSQINGELSGINILLAEDAIDNQLLVTTILTRGGASVHVANNGAEAMSIAMTNDFDLILMDLQMPGIDGYQATRALRRRGYSKPIIALTAHAMLEERVKTAEAGCDAHLTKPLDIAELFSTVKKFKHMSTVGNFQ